MIGMSMNKTTKRDTRPFTYLWVFDPQTREVVLEDERGDGMANYPMHKTMAPHIVHAERTEGYAVAIEDGWRIFDDDFEQPDPYITEKVRLALEGKHPPPPLPNVLPHGSPHLHSV